MEQYFLTNPHKIATIISAADICCSSRVVELGSGIGSVAGHFMDCQDVTLVEKDGQLAKRLFKQFPLYRVIQDDAMKVLPLLHFDVLLSNLPFSLMPNIFKILSLCSFKIGIVTMHYDQTIQNQYVDLWDIQLVEILEENDFSPSQPFRSRVIKIVPRVDKK